MTKKIPVSQSPPLTVNPFAALAIDGVSGGAPPVVSPTPKKSPGRVVLRREKSGRGGKTVIVAGDFATHISGADLDDLARRARQACGCGGTVTAREIELQGDDSARVRRFFEGEGFRVAGG